MRITNQYLSNHLLSNLNNNLERLQSTQNKLSSGKAISKPSDDPVRVNQSLNLSTVIADNEQFIRNTDMANSWMDITDSSIGQAVDTLQRARELTVRGANDSMADVDRKAIASEITQIKEQLRQIGNTQYGGRFIFGGFQTIIEPDPVDNPSGELYPKDVSKAANNTGEFEIELSPSVRLSYNTSGVALFGDTTTGNNIFQVLDDLETDLNNGNTTNISGALSKLDKWIDTSNEERALVGGKVNRLDLTKNRLLDTNVTLEKLRSENEDVDMAETITDLNMQQNVYQAALAAGAKVIQPSLMDFLR